ncbi:MAG: CHAT domain-containing protein [Nitrospirales bacterium]|nr:CHAT domain-containing protein [Nitrospirales bacterium]
MLVDPILPFLEGCSLVYLVPYGDLVRLPLHAFKTCAGFCLIERYEIAYIPSTTLLRSCLKGSPSGSSEALIMAFEGRFPQEILSHACEEADAVGRSLSAGKVFTGGEATAVNFLEHCRDKAVIHLACHGEFNRDDPMKSCLYLYDRAVTAEEIFGSMEIKADLVTLSACRTAQALVRPGDETFGLIRALFHAGASALIVSLWNVNDESALTFMEKFYGNIRTMTVVKALAETQREMMAGPWGHHLKFWAPFILVGNCR